MLYNIHFESLISFRSNILTHVSKAFTYTRVSYSWSKYFYYKFKRLRGYVAHVNTLHTVICDYWWCIYLKSRSYGSKNKCKRWCTRTLIEVYLSNYKKIRSFSVVEASRDSSLSSSRSVVTQYRLWISDNIL